MYRERPSTIAGVTAWTSIVGGAPVAVLPDGCMDLLWLHQRLVVAGPDTVAQAADAGVTRADGLRFAPGRLPSLLGVPAHALRDRRVELDQVWHPAEVRRLEDLVAGRTDPLAGLEAVATERARRAEPVAPRVVAVADALGAGVPVGAVAEAAGLSARQLHRRSLDAFGYGPKTLSRVLRLQRALALARAGRPFAEVAAEAGYADQPHLARDVRALTGGSLGRLVR